MKNEFTRLLLLTLAHSFKIQDSGYLFDTFWEEGKLSEIKPPLVTVDCFAKLVETGFWVVWVEQFNMYTPHHLELLE